MKRLFVPLCMCLLLTACGMPSETTASETTEPASVQFYAMDTLMQLTAYGEQAETAVSEIQQSIQKLDRLLDRTDPDSQVSQLNRTGATAVDPDFAALLSKAETYRQRTGGAFDITIAPVMDAWGFTTDEKHVPEPDLLTQRLRLVDGSRVACRTAEDGTVYASIGAGQAVDLGGLAKGYAAQKTAELFESYGIESALAELGGNIYACGSKTDAAPWKIAVQDPAGPESYAGVLSLTDAYAVTSGGYQRYFEQDGHIYHHIIDPATGYPAERGLTSVTVVAGKDTDGALCDALSTALFVMGETDALDFWRQDRSFDLVLVTTDGRVLVTENLSRNFQANEESGYTYETIR